MLEPGMQVKRTCSFLKECAMRHLSRILFPLLLLLLVLPACSGAATPSSPPAVSLVVFAGAALTEPFVIYPINLAVSQETCHAAKRFQRMGFLA